MRDFWVKWGILVAKMFALGLNWGTFEEKKRDFWFTCELFVEEMCDFQVKWGILKEKAFDLGVK